MSALEWVLAAVCVLLALCVAVLVWAHQRLRVGYAEQEHQAFLHGASSDSSDATVTALRAPDYTVSITDWGEDFDGLGMRWRWVIWKGRSQETPVDLGNANLPSVAWVEVYQAITRDDPLGRGTRMSVEWKTVVS